MRLSTPVSFALQASIVFGFLASSSAPTPLYALYQAAWGFSPITVTVVFGVYAVAVLATLLVVGSLSDYIGRRPVLIAATLVQAAAMIVFATADSVGALLAARIVQGIATGAAAGAVGAGLLDLDPERGAIANAVVPMLGTASGGIVAGLFVRYLPAPMALVYLAFGAVFVLQAILVVAMPETVARRPGALASLRPKFALPPAARAPLLVAAPALIAAWAVAGFYASIGPALVRMLTGSKAPIIGGLALFVLAGSGATAVYLARAWSANKLLASGTVALVAGSLLTLLAIDRLSIEILVASFFVSGAGFGGAFQGAIRSVVPLAKPNERAGVLSLIYVIAYLAMGVPAVIGGVRFVHGGGVITTSNEYATAVMLLGAFVLASLARAVVVRRRLFVAIGGGRGRG